MVVRIVGLYATAAAAAVVVWLSPTVVWACGSYVVSVTAGEESSEWGDDVLVHDAEKMLYVDRGDGRWTIYQGRSIEADDAVDEFAWLLPVPGTPEVEVAPQLVFQRLQEVTRPEFVLRDESTGDCPAEVRSRQQRTGLDLGGGGASQSVGHEGEAPVVQQVDSGSVGPYDYVTIETDKEAEDAGKKAVEWLEKHDYRVESVDVDLLREYLSDGLNLLAMRLRADARTEDVQPVAITVEMEQALSPMRLARAGAAEETSILVWTAAEGRAVPYGWPRVEIDEGLVDWTEEGANYMDVVAAAVEEAEGRGFSTDFLMDSDVGVDRVWPDEARQRWAKIGDRKEFEGREKETLQAIAELFDHDELLAVILYDEMPMLTADHLEGEVEVGHFEAEYEPQLFSPSSRTTPRTFLNRLRGGQLVVECFDQALSMNWGAGGHFAATVVDPAEHDEVFEDVDSSLADGFFRCVRDSLRDHIESTRFVSDAFPMEMELRFFNPYQSPGDERGFPALMALPDEALQAVDWKSVVERIDEAIAAPLERAADRLAATDRLTRLSTVVKAENLTRDVAFVQVSGHRDRPATRRATRRIECDGDEERENGSIYTVRDWSVTLDGGQSVTGRGVGWPVGIGDRDAARRIVKYDRRGQVVDATGDAAGGGSIEVDVEASDEE